MRAASSAPLTPLEPRRRRTPQPTQRPRRGHGELRSHFQDTYAKREVNTTTVGQDRNLTPCDHHHRRQPSFPCCCLFCFNSAASDGDFSAAANEDIFRWLERNRMMLPEVVLVLQTLRVRRVKDLIATPEEKLILMGLEPYIAARIRAGAWPLGLDNATNNEQTASPPPRGHQPPRAAAAHRAPPLDAATWPRTMHRRHSTSTTNRISIH